MASLFIQTVQGQADYTLRARLDGQDYNFRFLYNQLEDRWYVSIADESSNPIVTGIKLVAMWPLLRYYRSNPLCPPGELLVTTTGGDDSPPGFDELGVGLRCQLVYVPSTPLT